MGKILGLIQDFVERYTKRQVPNWLHYPGLLFLLLMIIKTIPYLLIAGIWSMF